MSLIDKETTASPDRPFEHQLRFFPKVRNHAVTSAQYIDQMLEHLACHEAEIAAYIEEERRRKAANSGGDTPT